MALQKFLKLYGVKDKSIQNILPSAINLSCFGDLVKMEPAQRRVLDRLFNPRAMALFGGIGSPGSFGYLTALSQIRYLLKPVTIEEKPYRMRSFKQP
jgi:hypothetical protein